RVQDQPLSAGHLSSRHAGAHLAADPSTTARASSSANSEASGGFRDTRTVCRHVSNAALSVARVSEAEVAAGGDLHGFERADVVLDEGGGAGVTGLGGDAVEC